MAMTAKAALPVIPDYDSAVRVLKDPDTFPQWDGTFRTPYGLVSASMTDQIDAAWTVVPSISSLIPEVGSASSLIPDMRGGAYGFAQTALFLDPPLHARFRSLLEESWATRTYLPAVARVHALCCGAFGGNSSRELLRRRPGLVAEDDPRPCRDDVEKTV